MGTAYDAFISYSKHDQPWVENHLIPRLQAAGITYLDYQQFQLGTPKLNEIERAVISSRKTLLIVSKRYLQEDWQGFTSILASSYGLDQGEWPAIPLIIEDCELPTRLKVLTSLDLSQPTDQDWVRLITTLKSSEIPVIALPPVDSLIHIVDTFLNSIHKIARPEVWVVLAILMFSGVLVQPLVLFETGQFEDWRILLQTTALSYFLVLLGAVSMRAGHGQLQEKFQLNAYEWLVVIMHKYTGAAVWAYGWWGFLWSFKLFYVRVGLAEYLGEAVSGLTWGLGLIGLAGTGYIGARQAILQSQLFMNLEYKRRTLQDIFLFLTTPLIPIFLSWLIASSWRFLTETFVGLLLNIAMFLVLAFLTWDVQKQPIKDRKDILNNE